MSQTAANIEIFLALTVLGLSLLLAAVAGVSFLRLRNRRALLVSLGFLAFAAKGVYLTTQALTSAGSQPWVTNVALLDLLALAFLYLSVRVR